MDGLLRVGDATLLHQRHHTVGEHLRVDAQVLVVLQRQQNGVRNTADAHLQCGSIDDEVLGDQLADLGLDRRRLLGAVRRQRVVHVDGEVKMRFMNDGVAESPRQLLVDLCCFWCRDGILIRVINPGFYVFPTDDCLCVLKRLANAIHTGSQRAVAMVVRWRHLTSNTLKNPSL